MPRRPVVLNQMPQGLEVPPEEMAVLTRCVERAMDARHKLSYKLSSPLTADDFLRWPYLLGWVAVEVVREKRLSLETRRRFAAHTLWQVRPLDDDGVPYGLMVLAAFLAGQGVLDLPRFEVLVKTAEIARSLFDTIVGEELRTLTDWLLAQSELDDQQRLWWFWFLPVHCNDHKAGKPWLDYLLAHPAISQPFKHRLCRAWLAARPPAPPPASWRALDQALAEELDDEAPEPAGAGETADLDEPLLPLLDDPIGEADDLAASLSIVGHLARGVLGGYVLLPQYLQRRAVLGLAETGADPLAVCQIYFDPPPGTYEDALRQGVADVLRQCHSQMAPEAARAVLEMGLARGNVIVRKAFYEAAAAMEGAAGWARAQNDVAESLRRWAAKNAARSPQ